MGFLQRIFSLKSIKNKKKQKQRQQQQWQEQLQEQLQEHRRQINLNSSEELQVITDDEEHEAAIGRLLRSSSARFAVVSELDYASLPPLPHPINNVIQTPATSTISLSSSNTSHRGTYNVQVHKRKRHASTEFPFANRHLEDCKTPQRTRGATAPPKEHSHYLGLRSDPSVASLLELYDEHGRLPEKVFSNSPPSPDKRQGRAQTRRSGSTLRQLLGAPSSKSRSDSNADLTEGDISWAERFLGESDSVSSLSSIGVRTPAAPQAHPLDGSGSRRLLVKDDSTDQDLSMSTINNPALNSLEVELSIASDSSVNLESALENNSPYSASTMKLPQRASQVFKFLTQKKSLNVLDDVDGPLPKVPSSPASHSGKSSLYEEVRSDNASALSSVSSIRPATPIPLHDDTQPSQIPSAHKVTLVSSRIPLPNITEPRPAYYTSVQQSGSCPELPEDEVSKPSLRYDRSRQNEVKVIMTGPTKVIVTAPTPSSTRDTPTRIPRGPRGPQKKRSSSSSKHRSLLTECSNAGTGSGSTKDPYTNLPRQRKQYRRTVSQASSTSSLAETDLVSTVRPVERPSKSRGSSVPRRSSFTSHEKENVTTLSVRPDLPSTPMRAQGISIDSRSLFRSIVMPGAYQPLSTIPSPASSSELSPAGQKLMMDVRQQRMKARESERERNRRRGERYGSVHVA
ncbi:hypothetical protein AX17_002673 [Amanita inopinata Kibby_2008]|nr:hypothetical protein AX17_002673 [Amanita inopinata Kibby_2008]